MWTLELLGPVNLTDEAGAPVASVLAQPSRMAILAYLVLAPGDYQRRDALLGLFWPDVPTKAGRNRLRQAVHFLRQEVPSLVTGRGREEVGIDHSRIRCDAVTFDALVSDGRLEEGLALYRGPLMAGFAVPPAPGFELWLEERRSTLNHRAGEATWMLAERMAEDGAGNAATIWARRAAAFPGASEATVRDAMRMLAELGDHAGAIDAYSGLCTNLAALFQEEPSEATRSLAEEIRHNGRDAALSDEDEVAIRLLVQRYVQNLLDGEIDRAISGYTDDVVFSPPMEPMVRGRQAVREWIASRPPLIDYTFELEDPQGTQSQVWARGHMEVTVEPTPGERVTMKAKAHCTYVRQPDGQWLCSQVMWNLAAPGPVV